MLLNYFSMLIIGSGDTGLYCINNVKCLNRTWVEQITQPVCPSVLFLFGLFLGDLGGALLPVWMKMVLKLYVKYCYAGFVSEAPAVGQSTPAVDTSCKSRGL